MSKKSKESQFLEHIIDCEKLGNLTVEEALEKLRKTYNEIKELIEKTPYVSTKKVYNDMLKKIISIIDNLETYLINLCEKKVNAFTDYESKWQKDFSEKKNYIIPSALAKTILFYPIAKKTNLKERIENFITKLKQNTDSILRTSYITDLPSENNSELFEEDRKTFEKNLETEIRTINTSIFRNTDKILFKLNKQKSIYISILDSHTCLVCASYHGQIFDSEKAPMLPVHENCRCYLMPYSNTELEFNSYSDWLKTLDDKELLETLGKGRYQLYKNGVSVNSFVNEGKIITLKDLKTSFK